MLLFAHYTAHTQSKIELEQKRIAITSTINDLNSKLLNTKADKTNLISRYNTLEAQIESRQELIKTIQEEIKLVSKEIEVKEISKDTVDEVLEKMIEEYAILLKIDYTERLKKTNKYLLLTSGSILEAFTKWRYLKQFELYLNSRLNKINKLNTSLTSKEQEIINDKSAKETLLDQEKQNLELLEKEMGDLEITLKEKVNEQSTIDTAIKNYSTKREKLNKEIEKLYFNSRKTSNTPVANTTSIKKFEQKKGFMPWPIAEKKVELRYGEQYHPVHQNIKIYNSGIDISSPNKEVYVITNGRVVSVAKISNNETTVIIQHDNDYYTVYSNLKNAFVNLNDTVSPNQTIGELNFIKNKYPLHFEIWKGKQNLNPTNWLQNN